MLLFRMDISHSNGQVNRFNAGTVNNIRVTSTARYFMLRSNLDFSKGIVDSFQYAVIRFNGKTGC